MTTKRQKESAYEEMITTMSDKRRLASVEGRLRKAELEIEQLKKGEIPREQIRRISCGRSVA
jgi:hypothetical protein